MTAAVHPGMYLVAIIALIAVLALVMYLAVRNAPLDPYDDYDDPPRLRIVGTTEAVEEPDRYQARQAWPWNVTPERATRNARALRNLDDDARRRRN